VTTFRFYLAWFKLGRAYRKAIRAAQSLQELTALMAWLDATAPAESMGDQVSAWLAAREDEEDAA
jgi:hypothetical protein